MSVSDIINPQDSSGSVLSIWDCCHRFGLIDCNVIRPQGIVFHFICYKDLEESYYRFSLRNSSVGNFPNICLNRYVSPQSLTSRGCQMSLLCSLCDFPLALLCLFLGDFYSLPTVRYGGFRTSAPPRPLLAPLGQLSLLGPHVPILPGSLRTNAHGQPSERELFSHFKQKPHRSF